MIDRDAFFEGYVTCALWSTTDDSPSGDDAPLDAAFSPDDLDDETAAQMRKDCEDFIDDNEDDLEDSHLNDERAGHDFWLTREGHGAGFWDEGLGELGARLTKAAKVYGSFHLYADFSASKVRSS